LASVVPVPGLPDGRRQPLSIVVAAVSATCDPLFERYSMERDSNTPDRRLISVTGRPKTRGVRVGASPNARYISQTLAIG
jgi:hypothetical protein